MHFHGTVCICISLRKYSLIHIRTSRAKENALGSFFYLSLKRGEPLISFNMHKWKPILFKLHFIKYYLSENKFLGRKRNTNEQWKFKVPVRIPVKATYSLLSLMWKNLLCTEVLHYMLWSIIKQGWNKQDSSLFHHWYVPCSKCIKRKYFHHTITG